VPAGWEKKFDAQGRFYFVNHKDKSTTWLHPITGMFISVFCKNEPE